MPTIKYVFRDKPLAIKNADQADPQKIGEALAAVRSQTKGRCNSSTYLQAAADRRSPMYAATHHHLEWNDAVAGHKYRLSQMREIISCIDLVDKDKKGEKRQVPAFISLNSDDGRSYYNVKDVMNSADLMSAALRQAEADMLAYERRLMGYADICSAIRKARELIAERRARYEKAGGYQPHA